MYAHVGDELVIEGHRVGQPRRCGTVLEVRGNEGGPPFLVRWDDSEHPTLLFPGSDCLIHHLGDTSEKKG